MKIIELTETQFKNYSKLHSSRNYYQTVEYAHSDKGTIYYLGYINENDNTLMAAVLLLERSLGKIKENKNMRMNVEKQIKKQG